MDGITLSWLSTALLAVAILVVLLVSLALAWRGTQIITARFYCPWVQREVIARQLTCDGKHPIGVIDCRAFADSRVIPCGAPCIGRERRLGAGADDRQVVEELLGS